MNNFRGKVSSFIGQFTFITKIQGTCQSSTLWRTGEREEEEGREIVTNRTGVEGWTQGRSLSRGQ